MPEAIFCSSCLLQALSLLVIANGAPVGAGLILRRHYSMPVDGGLMWRDGRPLFGKSKTWRGLVSSIGLTSLVAPWLDLAISTAALFALSSMMGDLASSFCKRRLGLAESSRVRGLDTLPESMLPATLLKDTLGLAWLDIIILAAVFLLIEATLTALLHQLHIRKTPY